MSNSTPDKDNPVEKNEKKRGSRILKIILIIILLVFCCVGGCYYYVRSMIKIPNNKSQSNNENKENAQYVEQRGINNILLIGVDSREVGERSRSDSMIIMTIDDNNKKLRLTSIMRDGYVPIKGHGEDKINAAFAFGGAELLINTLYENFQLNLDKYILVDFWGFEEVVDAVGGLEIDIKDYEIDEMNKFTGEATGGRKAPLITHSGTQHLNGQQVLAYSRIRKVGNGGYERDERQRVVISLFVEKLKDVSMLQYPKLLNSILPNIKTNMEPLMLLNYGYTVSKFEPLVIDELEIPQSEISNGRMYRGSWVLLMDIDQNAKVLNDFIYNDKMPNKDEFDVNKFKKILNEYLKNE